MNKTVEALIAAMYAIGEMPVGSDKRYEIQELISAALVEEGQKQQIVLKRGDLFTIDCWTVRDKSWVGEPLLFLGQEGTMVEFICLFNSLDWASRQNRERMILAPYDESQLLHLAQADGPEHFLYSRAIANLRKWRADEEKAKAGTWPWAQEQLKENYPGTDTPKILERSSTLSDRFFQVRRDGSAYQIHHGSDSWEKSGLPDNTASQTAKDWHVVDPNKKGGWIIWRNGKPTIDDPDGNNSRSVESTVYGRFEVARKRCLEMNARASTDLYTTRYDAMAVVTDS